jgi:hypothetical protein
LLNERHDFDEITKWTLSLDGSVFAFSREDGVNVYLVSPQVCGCCMQWCCPLLASSSLEHARALLHHAHPSVLQYQAPGHRDHG